MFTKGSGLLASSVIVPFICEKVTEVTNKKSNVKMFFIKGGFIKRQFYQ
jgi:hypothetical protein